MPPKAKITKQMIVESALQLIREEGHEAFNVRAISKKLNCSTQPIMYNFKTVEEIRQETYKVVDEYHSNFIMPKGRTTMNPLMELGLNYIRFGYKEKNLFKFLFQTNELAGYSLDGLIASPALNEIINMVSDKVGCGIEEAREVFKSLFITAHGCASLLANNALEYDEEQFIKILNKSLK